MMQQMALQQQQKNQNNSAKYINFKCFNVCKFEAEMKRTKTKATNNKTQKKICNNIKKLQAISSTDVSE